MYRRLIGLAGAQGVGKTVLLNELANRLGAESVVSGSVSRETQVELGHESLAEAWSTPDRMMEFQEAILRNFHLKCRVYDGKLAFIDRTPADIFAYASRWINNLSYRGHDVNKCLPWLVGYGKECSDAMTRFFGGTVYIRPNPGIAFVSEDRRGSKDDQEEVDRLIGVFLSNHASAVRQVVSLDLEARVAAALEMAYRVKR